MLRGCALAGIAAPTFLQDRFRPGGSSGKASGLKPLLQKAVRNGGLAESMR
jgi:hypothetical protein